jgi:hypothetical protein
VAYTAADLAAIDAVIARGELSVEFADRRVTYRSIDELLRARAVIAAELDAGAAEPRPRQYLGYTSKGF